MSIARYMPANDDRGVGTVVRNDESGTVVFYDDYAAEVARLNEQLEAAQRAEATLTSLGYTNNGGHLWKPPLGKRPDFSLMDTCHQRAEAAEAELKRRDAQEPVAWEYLDKNGNWQHEVDPEDAKNLGFTVRPLYAAAPAAVLPQEKSRISENGVPLALSDYDTGWNECLVAASGLGCQPEKVVKLPMKATTSNVPFAANGWNAAIDECVKALDAAGVKWVEGELK